MLRPSNLAAVMNNQPFEQAIPVVRKLAKSKAHFFVHRCRLNWHECEDVESHLVMVLLARWPRFNSELASIQTFASTLMDRELVSLFRHRLALSRQPRLPLELTAGPTSSSLLQFRIDVHRAMATLPPAVRKTAIALCSLSSTEAAEALGCSRQMLHRRKLRIREAFLEAGIDAGYFCGGPKQ